MHDLSDAQRKACLGDFCSIVGSLQGYDEAKNFFKDLLTTSEMIMISRRIQIARQLMKGWTHEQIRENLGSGKATIIQVDRWLNEGFGGYKQVLKKYKAKEDERKSYIPPAPFSFDDLRKRYPRQYLLINLFMAAKNKKNNDK